MQWYYSKSGTQHGPVTQAELQAKISSGEVAVSELVWKDGMPDWTPASRLPEFASSSQIPLPSADPATVSPYAPPTSPVLQPPYPGHYQATPTSGLAIASLVCGILSLTTCLLLPGIPAVICGHMALSNIKDSHSTISGRGMAIAGLVMGYVSIALLLFFILFIIIGVVSESGRSF